MRLFLDLDGCVLLWPPGKSKGTLFDRSGKPRINYHLLFAVKAFRRETGADLVVWSGMGEKYARQAAELLLPEPWTVMRKDARVMQWGDVAIDDERQPTACRVIEPADFIQQFGKGFVAKVTA